MPTSILQFWNRLSNMGVHGNLSSFDAKSIIFVNRFVPLVSLFIITSVIINLYFGTYAFVPYLVAGQCFVLGSLWANYHHYHQVSKFILVTVLYMLIFYISMFGGFGSGIEFYFISMMALPVVIYQRSRQIFLVQILCVIGLACQKYFARIAPRNADDQSVVMAFYVLNSFYSSFIIILGFTFYRRLNKRNEQELLDNNLLIIEKNKKLEQMNKSLDAFSSSVSHDLRAPVLSIEGFANLIQSQYSEKLGDGKELLDMILKNTETMKTLINDILVYAKSGKAEIKVTEIDLADLTRQIISEFAPIVSQNKTQVVLRPLGNVFADPLLMKMVMSNLISNAVKYSSKSESPFVEIGSMDGGEGKVFYVRDNGVGFDMKHYGKLFSIFKRLHSAADYEGSGVGLATVENIISRHGGKIWAESGNGSTTFFFSLSDG